MYFAQADGQYMSTGTAILVLAVAGIFLAFLLFALVAFFSYSKGLAGLIKEYESIVINRGGRFRPDKEVNPEGRDAENSSTILGLLFYRWPLFTWGVRVSRKWTEFVMDTGEIPMEGFEIEFGIEGKVRVKRAHPFVEKMDLNGPAGASALEEIVLSNALRILRQVANRELINTVGTIEQVRRPPGNFLVTLLPLLNEQADELGLEFTNLSWNKWGVPRELSQALASSGIAQALREGMMMRGRGMEREIEAFMPAARREAGVGAPEPTVRAIARRMWSVAAATTSGSADLPAE